MCSCFVVLHEVLIGVLRYLAEVRQECGLDESSSDDEFGCKFIHFINPTAVIAQLVGRGTSNTDVLGFEKVLCCFFLWNTSFTSEEKS